MIPGVARITLEGRRGSSSHRGRSTFSNIPISIMVATSPSSPLFPITELAFSIQVGESPIAAAAASGEGPTSSWGRREVS